jgi:hypothetical protein
VGEQLFEDNVTSTATWKRWAGRVTKLFAFLGAPASLVGIFHSDPIKAIGFAGLALFSALWLGSLMRAYRKTRLLPARGEAPALTLDLSTLSAQIASLPDAIKAAVNPPKPDTASPGTRPPIDTFTQFGHGLATVLSVEIVYQTTEDPGTFCASVWFTTSGSLARPWLRRGNCC